jgi:hypothetical protein
MGHQQLLGDASPPHHLHHLGHIQVLLLLHQLIWKPLSSYVPNILKGVQYAITVVYLENIKGGEQVPYMKVSFLLQQLNQIIQFFLIKQFFFSYSFN